MIKMPAKALVLAAGFGTRLLPLTRVVPKPLLPLWGRPMLDRALDMLAAWGVRDVLVNVHHGADAIVRHLTGNPHPGLRIQISFEPEILGTGGALVRAAWFFKAGEPFWIVNGDVAAEVKERNIARAFKPGKTIASAWLVSDRGPRTVMCRRGYITDFSVEKPGATSTATFCGVHLVDPAVLRYLPASGFSSIIPAYEKAMRDGWKVAGVEANDACWADIGTPAQYVETECSRRASSRAAELSAVRISRVNGVIYGPGVPMKPYAGIMAMRAEDALDANELDLARGWSANTGAMVACPLAPRGSSRSFTRLYDARHHTAMLVHHNPEREENNLYAGHARFLKKIGMPVPSVLAEHAGKHVALFEDAGVRSVQDEVRHHPHRWLENIYGEIVDRLVVFHERGYRAAREKKITLVRAFGPRLYRWEHELFADLFLAGRCRVPAPRLAIIRKELEALVPWLGQARDVLVHRDLQSSNILLGKTGWSFIDFQGMRYGPAVYDLASLLCDPYISIPGSIRERLLTRYARQANAGSRVMELFWPAVIQRLGQALGAYARLGQSRDTAYFLKHIDPALVNMRAALQHTAGFACLKETIHNLVERVHES